MNNQNQDDAPVSSPKGAINTDNPQQNNNFQQNWAHQTPNQGISSPNYTPRPPLPSSFNSISNPSQSQNCQMPVPPSENNASCGIFSSCAIAFFLAAFLQQPGFLLFGIVVAVILGIRASNKKKPSQMNYSSTLPTASISQPYRSAGLVDPNSNSPQMTPNPSSSTKSEIYRQFHNAQEYNNPWLDVRCQTLNLQPNDRILLGNWTKNQIVHKTSFSELFQTTFTLMLYFGLYGIIAFFVFDGAKLPANNAMQALFFPVLPYVLLSYRGLDKYLSAIILSIFLLAFVYLPLINRGIITAEGIVFLRYFLFLTDLFPGARGVLADISGAETIFNFTLQVLVLFFLLEGVLLILRWFFVSKPKVEMVITQNNIFLRDRTKRSRWEDFKLVLWIIINPFNFKMYSDMRKRIQYNKLSAQEGRYYDYAKIPLKAVVRVDKKHNSIGLGIVVSLFIIILGVFAFIPIAIVGLILLFKAISGRNSFTITITIDRVACEGSWILTHNSNIFKFDRTPDNIAQFFSPLGRN